VNSLAAEPHPEAGRTVALGRPGQTGYMQGNRERPAEVFPGKTAGHRLGRAARKCQIDTLTR